MEEMKEEDEEEIKRLAEAIKPEMVEFTLKLRKMGFSYLAIMAAFNCSAECLLPAVKLEQYQWKK
jgi:cell division protein ZapA (FtsZ GTPase activity inhibitor)